jgi:hypothetical protein
MLTVSFLARYVDSSDYNQDMDEINEIPEDTAVNKGASHQQQAIDAGGNVLVLRGLTKQQSSEALGRPTFAFLTFPVWLLIGFPCLIAFFFLFFFQP